MAFLDQDEPPYVFHIRSPLYTRALGLPLIAFVIGPLAYIYWNLGDHGTEELLKRAVDNFVFWLYILAMLGALAFAVWVIRPPQSTLARFEFSRDRVRFIPNLIARSIGEQSEETAISAQSAEILICHRLVDGYRIIMRAADGAESELASHSPHTRVNLNASEIDSMAEGITPATGLPVRAVVRRKSPAGAFEETPWTASSTKGKSLRTVALGTVGLPYVGGILMGCLSLNASVVIAVGLTLWLWMVLTAYVASRTKTGPRGFPLLQALTTLVTFTAAYAVCFVVTAHLRGRL